MDKEIKEVKRLLQEILKRVKRIEATLMKPYKPLSPLEYPRRGWITYWIEKGEAKIREWSSIKDMEKFIAEKLREGIYVMRIDYEVRPEIGFVVYQKAMLAYKLVDSIVAYTKPVVLVWTVDFETYRKLKYDIRACLLIAAGDGNLERGEIELELLYREFIESVEKSKKK